MQWPQTFTCVRCGREQLASARDLRRHERYPRDCYQVLCRYRDCEATVPVAVVGGELRQWAAIGDRAHPGRLEHAPAAEAAAWGSKPTHTPLDLSEYGQTRSGKPGRLSYKDDA